MADEPAKTIQDKYVQQYADDLAANRKEQGDLTAQIAGLQARLEQLRTDEHWLAHAQGSLPEAPTPSAPENQPAAEEADPPPAATAAQAETTATAEAVTQAPRTVPQQRQDQSAKEEQPKQPAKKTASAKKVTAKKTTAGSTAKKATAKKPASGESSTPLAAPAETTADKAAAEEESGPLLWQLVWDTLLKTPGQPCVAREVHDQLAQDHPDRATSVQTVRNNLEKLVKKSLAEKSNQQGSVMYTAYAEAGAAFATDVTAAGKAEQVSESAAEKVPAEA